MKKRKLNFIFNVVSICLSICAIAIGVYAIRSANLGISGSVGFVAHNCNVSISGYIYGHSTTAEGAPVAKPTQDNEKSYLSNGSVLATENEPLKIEGDSGSLTFGDVFFTDMTESENLVPIKIILTIKNDSKFTILLEDNSFDGENYRVICGDPLHVLYENTGADSNYSTQITYVLLPKIVDGKYQEITEKVNVSIQIKFSKLDTEISSTGFIFDDDTNPTAILGVPDNTTNADTIVIPSTFTDKPSVTIDTIKEDFDKTGRPFLFNIEKYKKVVLLDGIKHIGKRAFHINGGVVAFPSTLLDIGNDAFTNNTGITALNIQKGSHSSFYSIYKLKYISSASNVSFTNIDSCVIVIIEDGCDSVGQIISNSLEFLELPESVTQLTSFYKGNYASIKIPKNVTQVNGRSFVSDRLTSMIVDSENKKYDSRNNCNAIIETATNILVQGCKATIIPNDIVEIGGAAFMEQTLNSMTIPKSVKKLGANVFANCKGITQLHYLGTKAEWDTIDKGIAWNNSSTIKSVACSDGTITL